ncbi:MAG: pyroglutamyl-peptidase I [Candidatus Thorarchaeota archaeon]|nr:MAG: pyroglutamyl-peptidase I [Candidatus Thorarchaeota archaeon]
MVCSYCNTGTYCSNQLTTELFRTTSQPFLGDSVPTVLVTGFEPFDGFTINPSEEVAKALDGKNIDEHSLVGLVLPLDYKNALGILDEALEKHKPDYILCCGQANRAVITIERIAINVLSTKKPDNYDNTPETDIINQEGPAAYFANLDPHVLVKLLKENEIPADVSYYAGAYGCNWLLYNVMQRIQYGNLGIRATFIHLPPIPPQAIQKDLMTLATMPLDMIIEALVTIIKSLD